MSSTSRINLDANDQQVGLMILDEIHLLGADRGPILEVYAYEWWKYTSDDIFLSYFFIAYWVL